MNKALLAGGLLAMLALAACTDSTGDAIAEEGSGPTGSDTGGSNSATPATSSSGTASAPAASLTAGTTPGATQATSLTAGVWDDNLNFGFFTKYLSLSGDPVALAVPSFTDAERSAAQAQWSAPRTAKPELDIAFMIDTTGSMGDELAYIQSSIDGISAQIATAHPNLTPRYGLVVYRDFVDPFQTRSFDFADLATFKSNLDAQDFGGGGDYPEDVADGMTATLSLTWRTGNVARMTVWVADAPPHPGQEGSVHDSIAKAATNDVHFYPVAASGADQRTEFTMRTAAQMTGGRYVFLTDDSGIGDSHEEPHIPCYVVTPFNDAIERMVESELSGQHIDAPASDVLRTVGNPVNGVCPTSASGNVSIY